jgi:hypothetical protein
VPLKFVVERMSFPGLTTGLRPASPRFVSWSMSQEIVQCRVATLHVHQFYNACLHYSRMCGLSIVNFIYLCVRIGF